MGDALVLRGVVALCVMEALIAVWLLSRRAKRTRAGAVLREREERFMLTESKEAKEALASLGRRLLEAQEQERSRIARELHDGISQRLALLAIEVQQLDLNLPAELRVRSEELFQQITDISNDVQSLSHQLRSSKLEHLGIVAAMKGFCAECARQQPNLTVDFKSGGVPANLPPAVSVSLFRILQEALRNAVEHSGVLHVEARLHGTSAAVVLTVRDRGRGFDPGVAMHGRGLGLISMRERTNLMSGTISITSRPAWGTEISVHVPVDAGGLSTPQGTTKSDHQVPAHVALDHIS